MWLEKPLHARMVLVGFLHSKQARAEGMAVVGCALFDKAAIGMCHGLPRRCRAVYINWMNVGASSIS